MSLPTIARTVNRLPPINNKQIQAYITGTVRGTFTLKKKEVPTKKIVDRITPAKIAHKA
ncbi:hypothetical protein GCM10008027_26350 [Pseudoalteromonas gelatinilytica]|uniref:Uncharacterized protein n=1 Tax=Pseudoalteromonas gelatinilytica TaxID=1703256 RepID=A0ABQ1TP49_9GAMM|nr:hypothetical protein GCM10008027_26350 [Pseudoalteromonas profundi]